MINLSKLSDDELYEEMDKAAAARAELDFRFKKAEIKLMALTYAAQLAPRNHAELLEEARWAYREALGEEWEMTPPAAAPEGDG